MMAIEVEQKYRVIGASELSELENRLGALNPRRHAAVVQVDTYFSHPSRDFAKTDEALRLRRVDELNYITYKGPKLDLTTKTRREIELALSDGQQAADDMAALLTALGFSRVATVEKRRVHSTLRWQDWELGISLDEVANLGAFVELEIVTDESNVESARRCLAAIADQLRLTDIERRSYLEMLCGR